jgi:hypothetical protein
MLDLFRYGASLEAWTGMLLLCAALGFRWMDVAPDSAGTSNRRALTGFAIAGSTYWLAVSGHPQMAYYGAMGATLFATLLPFWAFHVAPDAPPVTQRTLLRFWAGALLWSLLGVLLAAGFLLPLYFDFVRANAVRVGAPYAWATAYGDTFGGTFRNFVDPLASDVNGAFGGTPLFLVAALVPVLFFRKERLPLPIWTAWALALFALLHALGPCTPVHYLAWRIFPMASAFRVPGRIAVVLPLLFLLPLSWLARARQPDIAMRRNIRRPAIAWLPAGAALLVVVAYWLTPCHDLAVTAYTPAAFRNLNPWIRAGTGVLSAVVLCSAIAASVPAWRRLALSSLLAGSCVLMACCLRCGTWLAWREPSPTWETMASQKQERLDYRSYPGLGMENIAIQRQAEETCLEPFLARLYREAIPARDRDDMYVRLRQGRRPDQAVIENYPGVVQPVNGSASSEDRVELLQATFNTLTFRVRTREAGILGLAYPSCPDWRASVNGNRVPVYRANGSCQAVALPKGESRVQFCCWSQAAALGWRITGLGIALAGGAAAWRCKRRRIRWPLAAVCVVLGLGAPCAAIRSFGGGTGLGARYVWTWADAPRCDNLAYGKHTVMSSIEAGESPYLFGGGRAVDGVIGAFSRCRSARQPAPFWTVDLHQTSAVASVVAYVPATKPGWNVPPLKVLGTTAADRMSEPLGELKPMDGGNVRRLSLPTPVLARYVTIQATGVCALSLDEVEVYASPSPCDAPDCCAESARDPR